MRFVLSYTPTTGGAVVRERFDKKHDALRRAAALIATNGYQQFEIRDQDDAHVIDEALIRRHAQGDLGNLERSE